MNSEEIKKIIQEAMEYTQSHASNWRLKSLENRILTYQGLESALSDFWKKGQRLTETELDQYIAICQTRKKDEKLFRDIAMRFKEGQSFDEKKGIVLWAKTFEKLHYNFMALNIIARKDTVLLAKTFEKLRRTLPVLIPSGGILLDLLDFPIDIVMSKLIIPNAEYMLNAIRYSSSLFETGKIIQPIADSLFVHVDLKTAQDILKNQGTVEYMEYIDILSFKHKYPQEFQQAALVTSIRAHLLSHPDFLGYLEKYPNAIPSIFNTENINPLLVNASSQNTEGRIDSFISDAKYQAMQQAGHRLERPRHSSRP